MKYKKILTICFAFIFIFASLFVCSAAEPTEYTIEEFFTDHLTEYEVHPWGGESVEFDESGSAVFYDVGDSIGFTFYSYNTDLSNYLIFDIDWIFTFVPYEGYNVSGDALFQSASVSLMDSNGGEVVSFDADVSNIADDHYNLKFSLSHDISENFDISEGFELVITLDGELFVSADYEKMVISQNSPTVFYFSDEPVVPDPEPDPDPLPPIINNTLDRIGGFISGSISLLPLYINTILVNDALFLFVVAVPLLAVGILLLCKLFRC